MELDKLFIRNLKKWRKNMGLSQKSLAERCNAAHSYIRQLESGAGHPSFAFMGKLADALNIEVYQLFYNEAAAKSDKPSRAEHLEMIKMDFLKRMANEFDVVIEKLK
jgi:transcriptional regulator with XRE-family HTH domain